MYLKWNKAKCVHKIKQPVRRLMYPLTNCHLASVSTFYHLNFLQIDNTTLMPHRTMRPISLNIRLRDAPVSFIATNIVRPLLQIMRYVRRYIDTTDKIIYIHITISRRRFLITFNTQRKKAQLYIEISRKRHEIKKCFFTY